jgi:hypothetical protein
MLRSALIALGLLTAPASDDPGVPDDAYPELQICNPIVPSPDGMIAHDPDVLDDA